MPVVFRDENFSNVINKSIRQYI